ncbi:palmitoleoyl-protein carboxylesterase notum1a-like isoform X1 [Stylophora pistillata]|uniref:Protein notum-like n=1 Tax=Stylophora pistillata TaxID=50429 RepID=A0A2B4SPX8_STYPI|nr:palmitoleoyl-protein carboxylesterase notum1a-like isoform X1 [Stylophora pistillata]PFX31169.1 Protein notum-like [Stylophora pistillata]
MFLVFTAMFFWAFLGVPLVDCSIDLQQESLNEGPRQFVHLAKQCPQSRDLFMMKLHHLTDRNVTCNDGTPAGYYLRKAHGSKRWIVYLAGGEFCTSSESCNARYSKMKYLMSSATWSSFRFGTGILSSDPVLNPTWWNANLVYIPYCSSDAWIGNASASETGERFSFVGSRILERVFMELTSKGLDNAKRLLVAGSSAGGIGVILNLDRIDKRLEMGGLKIDVRGLADSGWYLDIPPCPAGGKHCQGAKLQENNMISIGMTYWRGVVPDDCARRNPQKKWKCFFGEHVYRTDDKSPKHSPLFVFQWLYDSAQLVWSIGANIMKSSKPSKKEIDRVLYIGNEVRDSFNRTKGLSCAVFAPSCISHGILNQDDWLKVLMRGKNLNHVINDWYQSSGQETRDCPSLIGTECNYPHCNPTCPSLGRKLMGLRSHGKDIKTPSDKVVVPTPHK